MSKKEALAENKALKAERDALKAELAALKRLFFNSKKEHFESTLSSEQLPLFNKYIKDTVTKIFRGKKSPTNERLLKHLILVVIHSLIIYPHEK